MHPLEKFRYCPVCGSSHFEIQDEKSKRCENCGFEYFLNPSSAVAAFITNEKGELLVLTRKKDPGKGTLDLPGGFCDIAETAEEAIIREVKEETGLDVTRAEYLFSEPNKYLYSGFNIPTLDIFYHCEVADTQQVKAMDSTGAVFDADIHDAVTTFPTTEEDMKGKVIDTVQKGYTINDKVLRHAKVVVGQ